MTIRQRQASFAGWRLRSLVLAITLWGSPPAWADTFAGLEAFRLGRFSEASQAWRSAAAEGDAVAALYLGVLYDTGFGVAQSPSTAFTWYRRAAAGGNPSAMLNTAIMFDAGRGTPADPVAAAEWYQKAAGAGSGRAAFNLGLLYESGIGVPADRQQAKRYFRLAVANGVVAGQAHLARLGERQPVALGHATADPAMVIFQQAQQALLSRGPNGDMQAATLFRQAAERGNALAAYNLAYCYEHGIGVSADADQALAWYRRSASGTNDPALKALASSGSQALLSGVAHVQR